MSILKFRDRERLKKPAEEVYESDDEPAAKKGKQKDIYGGFLVISLFYSMFLLKVLIIESSMP